MHSHLAILRDDHLGDMILTTPLARTLGNAGWKVTVVGKKAWADVWRHNPHATYSALETIAPDYPHRVWTLARWLHRLAPTHVLVPYYRPPLLWASFLSGRSNRYCQMGRVLGRLTLHHCLRTGILHTQRHMGEVWQDFAAAVGVTPQSPQPEIFLSEEEKDNARKMLAQHLPGSQPLVMVNPFHGGNTCHLSISGYVEVVRELQSSSRCRIVITGMTHDREIWKQAAAFLPVDRIWVSCGQLSLRELFAVTAQADWLVCGGTGPLHVASAVNTSAVAMLCADPKVSSQVWGNLVPGTVHLTPSAASCSRLHASGTINCGFCEGPFPDQVAQAVLDRLG